MKIYTKKNNNTIFFDFSFDISKNRFLEKIIRLYSLDVVYINIYALNNKNDKLLISQLKDLKIDKYLITQHHKNTQDIVIMIKSSVISDFIDIINTYKFDELTVWSCYTDWDEYLKNIQKVDSFLTIKKKSLQKRKPSFYLNYNIWQGEAVEIICDLELNKDISSEDIYGILNNSIF